MVLSKFGYFDYILVSCGGIVVCEAAVIIAFNIKRGYWEPTNKLHVLSAVLYLIYLSMVIYSSVESTRSAFLCDFLWKVCDTLYIAVTMSVYSYNVTSRVVNSVRWRGKRWCERIVLVMTVMVGLAGFCFFWLPIKDFQYNGILVNGVCHLVHRRWMAIVWVIGGSLLSVSLLILFLRALRYIEQSIGDTPRSIVNLQRMKRMTEKNRNLLLYTVTVTMVLFTVIAVIGNLTLRTVIYISAIDRLVTLQCITMTFSYDGSDFFYCCACFILFCKKRKPGLEQEEHCFTVEIPSHNSSSSLFIKSIASNLRTLKKLLL